MTESIETRVTRLEEHAKQNTRDISDIKTLIKEHTQAEMESITTIQEQLGSLDAATAAAKFGWKVLITAGTIGIAVVGFITKYAGVFTNG